MTVVNFRELSRLLKESMFDMLVKTSLNFDVRGKKLKNFARARALLLSSRTKHRGPDHVGVPLTTL